MSRELLVDTDVLIDVLRGHDAAVVWLARSSASVSLSAITVAELYAGVKGAREMALLRDMLGLFPILPVTTEVARLAGQYRHQYRPSHGVGIADALIAATAAEHRARLVSLNRKHFPMLERVETPYSKSH